MNNNNNNTNSSYLFDNYIGGSESSSENPVTIEKPDPGEKKDSKHQPNCQERYTPYDFNIRIFEDLIYNIIESSNTDISIEYVKLKLNEIFKRENIFVSEKYKSYNLEDLIKRFIDDFNTKKAYETHIKKIIDENERKF